MCVCLKCSWGRLCTVCLVLDCVGRMYEWPQLYMRHVKLEKMMFGQRSDCRRLCLVLYSICTVLASLSRY